MKRVLAIYLLVLALSAPVFAANDIAIDAKASRQGSLSATQAAAELKLNAQHLVLINDGANEVYIKFNSTVAAAVTDFELKSGESIVFDTLQPRRIFNLRYVCAAGEAATVRYIAWD